MDAALPATVGSRAVHPARALLSRPRVAITLGVALLTLVLFVVVPRPLSPDVSGQLWIAGRLREGARLYRDISEINPPLWFWLAVPIDALADALGVGTPDVLIPAIGGAALLSLLATERLLQSLPAAARATLLLYGAGVLLVMPLRDLGQREQLALIGALPYAALIAARRERRPVPGWLAVAVGGGAAIGFAFKHYFVGAPLLLEAWLILGARREWRPWRPELLILAGAALAYAAAILVVTPDYLRLSLPELALAYGGGAPPALRYLLRPAQPVWLLIGCALWVARPRGGGLPPLAVALLVAGAGFSAAWAIQHKGWPYHSIPTTGLLAMALATTVATGPRRRPGPLVLAALAAPLLLGAIPTQWAPGPTDDIAPALADLRAGDSVAIVSVEGFTLWPATIDRGFRYPGRRLSFWMLPIVDANPGDPRLAAFGRRVVREAAADYRCRPPRRLVFAPGNAASGRSAADDPLDYFRRDPGFAALLGRYRRLDRPGNFDAFELADRLPADCRQAPL